MPTNPTNLNRIVNIFRSKIFSFHTRSGKTPLQLDCTDPFWGFWQFDVVGFAFHLAESRLRVPQGFVPSISIDL